MKLQLESWNRYLTDASTIEGFTVQQELQFDRFLNEAYNEQSLILEDFSKLIEHYSSGGILLESKECYLIEKRLNRDKQNSKILAEIKRNPKRLDEAGLLTLASIPTAIGLLSKFFGWALKTGISMYVSGFDETSEEYIARLSSSEEIANQMVDPTIAPSVAARAGRGVDPSDADLGKAVTRERNALYKSVMGKSASNIGDTSKLSPDEAKDKLEFNKKIARSLSKMSPFQRKAVSAVLNLSENSTKFGQWIQDLVKKAMIKISQLFGTGLNRFCRDEQEREEKKVAMELAFEKVGLFFYCALIAAGAIYLVNAYAIPAAIGATGALASANQLIDNASTAMKVTSAVSVKADIASLKSILADAIDTSASVAKAEKTTHFTHYISEILKAVKGNAKIIFTEIMDIIGDCGKKVAKAASSASSSVSGLVDKFKNWWNKED